MGGWLAILLNLLSRRSVRGRVLIEVAPAAPLELAVDAAAVVRIGVEAAAPIELTVAPARVDVTAEVAPP